MRYNKQAFSFVEIIIVVSILTFITIVGLATMNSQEEKTKNTKVVSDIETINNALLASSSENADLPMPEGNINFFTNDGSYSHGTGSAYGVYGSVTDKTIAKKYLDITPLDPRTNSYYSYGKVLDENEFEIAGVEVIDTYPKTKVSGNYTAENGPYGLIREYNGPNFVYDLSKENFPYNPDELVLLATDKDGNIYMQGDTIKINNSGEVTKNSDTNILTTQTSGLELFFSDGSVSILEPDSELILNELSFPARDNLNTVVRLALKAGTIWTRATKLNDRSQFEVYTTDSTAAVRGTIFGVTKTNNGTIDDKTEVVVIEGTVEVYPAPVSMRQDIIIPAESVTDPKTELRLNESNSGAVKTLEVTEGQSPKKIERKRSNEVEEIPGSAAESSLKTDFDFYNLLPVEKTQAETIELKNKIDIFSANEDKERIQKKQKNNRKIKALQGECEHTFAYNSECIENNLGKKWKVVFYDGYDNKDTYTNSTGSQNMADYLKEDIFEKNSQMKDITMTMSGFTMSGGTLNASGISNFLKYNISSLDLEDNFAIEMSVRGGALSRTGRTNYYLFDNYNSDFKVWLNDKKLYLFNGYNSINIDLLDFQENKFYKIQVIKAGGETNLKVIYEDGNTGTATSNGTNSLGDKLYIGSKKYYYRYINQWNDIIDYVKIYKKD